MSQVCDPVPVSTPCGQSASKLFHRAELGPTSWCAPGPLPAIEPALLDAPPPTTVAARLALEAPGSDTKSGLIDIAVVCPNARRRRSMSKPAHRHVARLALEAPRSDGSGVVVVDDPVTPTRDSGGYVLRPSIDALPPVMEHSSILEAANSYPRRLIALFATVAVTSFLVILFGLTVVTP